MKKFLCGLISESDGKPSFARIGSALIVLSAITWISFVVFKSGKLPDQIAGAGLFVSGSLGALYSANKVSTVFQQPST